MKEREASNVVAALASLASDFDALLLDSSSFEEKITIPSSILVPAISRHLESEITSDRAIRALATLLALGSVVGDYSFAGAVYSCTHENVYILDSLMNLLEKAGSSTKVLGAKEQAARALFYLTDKPVISALLEGTENGIVDVVTSSQASVADSKGRSSDSIFRVSSSRRPVSRPEEDAEKAKKNAKAHPLDSLDVHRALQTMLDHATCSSSPSLQRWSTASIRNLVSEDQRRACAFAELSSDDAVHYESFNKKLVSTGSVMILCSLMAADDADTRSHATAALSAVIVAARAVDVAIETPTIGRRASPSDEPIVSAVVQSGGCGSALAQLLFSADNSVAGIGCSFACSLVTPLLRQPMIPSSNETLVVYREAALALATEGGCLPAFVQMLLGDNARPIELKVGAMMCLAAVCLACNFSHQRNVGDDSIVQAAIANLDEEGVSEVSMSVLIASSQNLVTVHDSPSSQLLEAAAIALSALCSFSSRAQSILWTRNAIFDLISLASERGMQSPSKLRGKWAPRCLPFLDCASKLMFGVWEGCEANERLSNHKGTASNTCALDCLLEALDAGAISLVSKVIESPSSICGETNEIWGQMLLQVSACRLVAALFGLANEDDTLIGRSRLYGAIPMQSQTGIKVEQGDKEYDRLISNTVTLLNLAASRAQQNVDATSDFLLQELAEQCTSALGSLFGAHLKWIKGVRATSAFARSVDSTKMSGSGATAASSLFSNGREAVATMLVGGSGEGSINPALRLVHAIVLNGPDDLHRKVACSGVLVPVIDLLHSSFAGENFSSMSDPVSSDSDEHATLVDLGLSRFFSR